MSELLLHYDYLIQILEDKIYDQDTDKTEREITIEISMSLEKIKNVFSIFL